MATQFQITPPGPFSFKSEHWEKWIKRFDRFRSASGLADKPDAVQIDMLIYCLGEQAEEIYNSFTFPVTPSVAGEGSSAPPSRPAERTFAEVKAKFENHFIARRNVIYERAKFNQRSQLEGEKVDEFITSLYKQQLHHSMEPSNSPGVSSPSASPCARWTPPHEMGKQGVRQQTIVGPRTGVMLPPQQYRMPHQAGQLHPSVEPKSYGIPGTQMPSHLPTVSVASALTSQGNSGTRIIPPAGANTSPFIQNQNFFARHQMLPAPIVSKSYGIPGAQRPSPLPTVSVASALTSQGNSRTRIIPPAGANTSPFIQNQNFVARHQMLPAPIVPKSYGIPGAQRPSPLPTVSVASALTSQGNSGTRIIPPAGANTSPFIQNQDFVARHQMLPAPIVPKSYGIPGAQGSSPLPAASVPSAFADQGYSGTQIIPPSHTSPLIQNQNFAVGHLLPEPVGVATGSEIDDQFTCPVHLDILVNPVVLQACQHWICKDCLQKYVNSKNGIDLECPECREPFDLPAGGVEDFQVNHRMRDICQTFLARQNSQSPEVSCGKHQGELLSRFCCKCLEAVCEECGDEDHAGHRIRNIGSAWRFAAPAIKQIFEKRKEAARRIDESLDHSITRRVEIDKMREAASKDVNDLRDKLCNHVTAQANNLIQEIERRFGEQDEKEEQYFQTVSASLKQLQNINKYQEHLKKMLSSNSQAVTESDLEALDSLKGGKHLNNTNGPTPRFLSYRFEPNPSMAKMLSESIGDILTDKELKQREATKVAANNDVLNYTPSSTTTPFQLTSSIHFATPSRPSSQLSVTPSSHPSGFLATPSSQSPSLRSVSILGDDRDPPPTDAMIRVRSRVMLPHSIVHPVDVEPYLEDRFIISDKTGSVTLISSSARSNGGRKVTSLKPSTNSEILVQSGVVVTRDKRLFTCNGTQTHVEQYDLDRIACVRRIGDETRFTSPRCLTHGVTNRMLYVSDIKGGVKVFDSYNGQHIDDIGGGLLLTPSGLTTDNNSSLFVADELQGKVYVFDIRMNRTQQPLQKLSTEINGTLLHCHDVAVSAIGNIYVTVTRHLISRAPVSLLLEYDGRGGCKRTGGWELRQPRGLRVDGRSATVVDEMESCIATYML